MYCTKCGFKNEDDAMFCANCGSVMTKKQSNDAVQPVVNTEEPVKMDSEEVAESVKIIEEVEAAILEQETTDVRMEEATQNIVEVEPQEDSIVEPDKAAQSVNIKKEESVQPQEQLQNAMNTVNNASIPVDLYSSPYTKSDAGNTYRKKRFSAPRFIFSMFIMLATICSIVTIAFSYVESNIKGNIEYSYDELMFNDSYSPEGIDIMKKDIAISNIFRLGEDASDIDEDEMIESLSDLGVDSKELNESLNTFRYFVIAFAVAMLVFCVIDFIMLSLVRNKIAYTLTLVFAIIKAALGSVAVYLWTADIFKKFENIAKMMKSELEGYATFSINLDFSPAVGLILALAMQAVIFISAIVLLCTKPKYIDVAPQTIQA